MREQTPDQDLSVVKLRDEGFFSDPPQTPDEICDACGIPTVARGVILSLWADTRAGLVSHRNTDQLAEFIELCWDTAQVYPEVAAEALYQALMLGVRDRDEQQLRLPEPKIADAGEVDLQSVLDHLEPAQPTLLLREDGKGLLYRGRTHTFFGQPESGKTWVGLHAIADLIRDAKRIHPKGPVSQVAVFVDFEDNAAQFVRRLAYLGIDPNDTARFCAYFSPTKLDGATIAAMAGKLALAGLVVVDSTNEAMAADALDPNSNQDNATFRQRAVNAIVALTDAAVVFIDHEGHAKNSRTLGGVMKIAAVTGAAFLVRAVQQPAPGKSGRLAIYVTKDREGAVRAIAQPAEEGSNRQHVANLAMEPNTNAPVWHHDQETRIGSLETRLWSPVGATSAHPVDIEAADALVQAAQELDGEGRLPTSKNKLFPRVRANGTKRDSGALRVSVEWLTKEGWLAASPGPGGHEVLGLGPEAANGQVPSDASTGSSGGIAINHSGFAGKAPTNSNEPLSYEPRSTKSNEPTPEQPEEARGDGAESSFSELPTNSDEAHRGGGSLEPPPLGGNEPSRAQDSKDNQADEFGVVGVDPSTGQVLFADEQIEATK